MGWDVLQHVEQEGDVPAVGPGEVQQIDLKRLTPHGQDPGGQPQGLGRGVGEGQFGCRKSFSRREVSDPAATAAAQVDHARGRDSAQVTVDRSKQEAVTAPIPEVPLLHFVQHGEAAGIVLVVTVDDGGTTFGRG